MSDDLIERMAKAIYTQSPELRPWSGDPYEFEETGASYKRELARRLPRTCRCSSCCRQSSRGGEVKSCHYCGPTDRELRPYGPGGAWVCHPCVTATPERNTAAQNAFGALLDAAGEISPTGVVAIGEAAGPRPFNPEEAK